MAPRSHTRQDITEWLRRAAEQALQAEAYHHAAVVNPGALEGRAPHQVARDAAAMQLIELAGCAENFTLDRGDPGTTLARFDAALRPVFELRNAHTHPESGKPASPLSPGRLREILAQLKTAIANLDPETLRLQAPAEMQALNSIGVGLARIEKDGVPDAAALRARDLHYAGYYHEIQFGRLAKATGLFDNFGKSVDVRLRDINSSIFDADHLAHKFHAMRTGADKSILPMSVVAPAHRDRVPGRLLSELTRELRFEYQTADERVIEAQTVDAARGRDAVETLASSYAEITNDPKAAALIRDYLQRKAPLLDRDALEAMANALRVAAAPDGAYLSLPEAVRDNCVELCLALADQSDHRLIGILDAAEAREHTSNIGLDPFDPEHDDDFERDR
jgi:hypothetical protein